MLLRGIHVGGISSSFLYLFFLIHSPIYSHLGYLLEDCRQRIDL